MTATEAEREPLGPYRRGTFHYITALAVGACFPPCARGEPYSLTKYVRCKEPPSKVSPCKKKESDLNSIW